MSPDHPIPPPAGTSPATLAPPGPASGGKKARCPVCRQAHLTRGTDGTWRLRVKAVAFPAGGGCNTSCTACGHDFELRLPHGFLLRMAEDAVDVSQAR